MVLIVNLWTGWQGGDWKLGGFELTAEITSDGPSYIYTAFQQYADVNYKSPGV